MTHFIKYTLITLLHIFLSLLFSDPGLATSFALADVAVSRDVSDYVITERWREVEQVLAGDTRILSIWTAWGDAKNEVGTYL